MTLMAFGYVCAVAVCDCLLCVTVRTWECVGVVLPGGVPGCVPVLCVHHH